MSAAVEFRPRLRLLSPLLLAPPLLLAAAPTLVLLAAQAPATADVPMMTAVVASLPLLTPLVLRLVGREWDPLLLSPAWVLCALGLAVIARVQPGVLSTQMLWISIGWAAFIALAGLPSLLTWLRQLRYPLLFGAALFTILTLVVGDDVTGEGARLWLRVGPVTAQPAELLRVLLIVFLAAQLAESAARDKLLQGDERGARVVLTSFSRDWLPLLGGLAIALLAVIAQRDFGPALLFAATFIAMLYLATGRRAYVFAGLGVAALLAVVLYLGSARAQGRLDAWLDPWAYPSGAGYQSLQAIGAFVFGGIFGAGPGYGSPGLIPAAHTDYPLAAIGEEWGLMGSLAVVALYALIVTRALRRARTASDSFAQLLAAGLAISVGLQVVIVFCGVLRLTPLTGLTTPFLSYGGSSMIVAWMMLALLTSATDPAGVPRAVAGDDRRRPLQLDGRIATLGSIALAAFGAVALSLGYWHVARADLAGEPAVGGARLHVAEARVMRGAILDRNGAVLAATEIGPDGTPRRVYAADSPLHLLGFTSSYVGAAGIEAVAADQLLGRSSVTPEDTLRDLLHEQRAGEDVQLTIDYGLQVAAEQAMGDAVGAVVAIDPRNGDILAMVSNPGFNPNFGEEEWSALRDDPQSPLLNRAMQGLYAPGSTFKTVTLAAALEYGLVTLDTPATCPGEVFIDGVRIVNRNEPPGRRTETVADAYAYSCNTYFAELGLIVGADRLRSVANAFGLTEDVPSDLPTARGQLSTSPGFLETDAGLAATAFGQGELQLSPLHLALVTAAIANDGMVPVPRLFMSDEPAEWRRAISPETARALAEAMEHGVDAGWASTAAIPNVGVGGKSGSAEVLTGETPHALFMGFAPVDDPEIAVVVVRERGGAGSSQAGPIVRAVIEAWLAR